MKIRIRGQSLRLRLGKSEVQSLADGQTVDEEIVFAPGVQFGVTLRPAPLAENLDFTADAGNVVIDIPAQQIEMWAGTDAVGISAELPVDAGQSLHVLIEKDFACIDNESGESQTDAFPNPSAACS